VEIESISALITYVLYPGLCFEGPHMSGVTIVGHLIYVVTMTRRVGRKRRI